MVCIYCNGKLDVNNSRPQKSRNQVWRRRRCEGCEAVFTAIEALDLSQAIMVVTEPDIGLEPFDRDRLFVSLHKSLQHRGQAAAISDARALADTATAHIIEQVENGAISRHLIKTTVLNTLQRFDDAAATHYAAFHPS